MATTKVSDLSAKTSPSGSEELLINDAGTSKKITIANANTMGSGFTVSATTDSNATTITQGDDLMIAAGTGITAETTADGTVTITNTVSGASTATSSATGVVKIEDDTDQSVAANAVSTTAGRTYGIQLNSSDQAVVNVPWTDTDTNTNQLTTFTVSATTDSNATTISQGDDLMFTAGTGITCETTADGTVTIASTVTDTNTMGSGFTVSATTDSNATTITQGDDLMFTAGTGITCETTADGTVTISNTVTDTNTMGSGFTVSATTDTNATTITQGDDLMFTAGSGITQETTADGTVTTTLDLTSDQAWTGSQRATLVTDNDGSFDLNAGQNFKCTPAGGLTLTFTNFANGQSGYIILVNSGGHAIARHGDTIADANFVSTVSAAGTYIISYISDGTDAFLTNSAIMA